MRVLYVSHTPEMSGAEYSLLELVAALDGQVQPIVACPPGPLAECIHERAIPHIPVRRIDGGSRLHPIHTLDALRALGAGARAIRRVAADVDIVHANLVRAGLIAAASGGRAPLVVHLRDAAKPTLTWKVAKRVVSARATAVIANSAYTAEHFVYPGFRPTVHVIPSPVDLSRFAELPPRDAARAALGLAPGDLALGVVAMLSPHKGQATAIEALARIRRVRPDARLVLVGSSKWRTAATTHDTAGYADDLRRSAAELGDEAVLFAGERSDIPAVMAALDIVLVPSWHEPWGRTVIEAMAAGTPVIASAVGGPTESIDHGRTGLLVEPCDPDALANAVLELAAAPERGAQLAAAAQGEVGRWRVERHAEQVLAVYEQARRQRAA